MLLGAADQHSSNSKGQAPHIFIDVGFAKVVRDVTKEYLVFIQGSESMKNGP